MRAEVIFDSSLSPKFRRRIWKARESNNKKFHFRLTTEIGGKTYKLNREIPSWALRFK